MGGITIWAMAEKSGARAKSKATDKSVRSTQAEATSKAAGEGARSTQALTAKQLGEIAEAEFIAKAVGMGLVVAKPWGDSEPYDFIVNPKKSFYFWRVQVKSAHSGGGGWRVQLSGARSLQRSYTAENIDALVAYARPMKCVVCDAGAGGGGVEVVDAVSGEPGEAVAV